MQYKLPKEFMGKPIKGAMKRLEESMQTNPNLPSTQPIQESNKQGMIHIPSIDLYFSKQRIHLNKDWNQTQTALKQEGLAMPTPYQFKEFLKHLKDNLTNETAMIYNEITQVRSPWRSNWINARFEKQGGKLYMISENALINGNYQTIKQELKNRLMQDKTPGISLDAWLNSTDYLGIPNSNIDSGSLWYWHPRVECVARFVAYSDWAFLDCYRNPDGSNASLGVFLCAKGTRQNFSGGSNQKQ